MEARKPTRRARAKGAGAQRGRVGSALRDLKVTDRAAAITKTAARRSAEAEHDAIRGAAAILYNGAGVPVPAAYLKIEPIKVASAQNRAGRRRNERDG